MPLADALDFLNIENVTYAFYVFHDFIVRWLEKAGENQPTLNKARVLPTLHVNLHLAKSNIDNHKYKYAAKSIS